jgi:uncharacterized repeat protein (TIGR01451 family)
LVLLAVGAASSQACGDSSSPLSAPRALRASTNTAPGTSDVQISGSSSTGSPNAGATFTYTFQVKNSNGDASTNIVLTDTLPVGTAYNSAVVNGFSAPCSASVMVVTCNIGTLPKGSQSVVTISLNAPVTAGSFTNTGVVTSDTPDPQPSNNRVTVTAQVKTALAACVVPPNQTTYTGLVMFGTMDQFGVYEQFEYQVNGVNYWVVTNYFDGTQPLTSVINLDCKVSPAQFVQVANFVIVTGVVDGTILLPGQTTPIPVLHASVVQVLTHKDAI